jgi:putative ABC transport system substrate-binding protein
MQRREFITLLGGTVATWPLAVRAQQPAGRVYRVGYLAFASREQQIHLSKAFEEGLRSLGYRVGENVVIEYRFANRQLERLPALAADLVRLGVDVIVTGAHQNTVAAMKAIPIVMTNSIDPVGAGLVASLARPGGNVTGFGVDAGDEIFGKRLELLKETLPNLSRVGILSNPDFAPNRSRLTSMREAAQALGLTLVPAEARGLDALEQAFATMVSGRAGVRRVGRARAVQLSRPDWCRGPQKSAAGNLYRERIRGGGLASDLWTRSSRSISSVRRLSRQDFQGCEARRPAGRTTDQVRTGGEPQDRAKALGFDVPPALLARADEVIE